jgi:hypothetical protein
LVKSGKSCLVESAPGRAGVPADAAQSSVTAEFQLMPEQEDDSSIRDILADIQVSMICDRNIWSKESSTWGIGVL